MAESGREGLLAAVGKAYYLEGRSKVEIAENHGISRFQVARLLDEARDAGIVRIEVFEPDSCGPQGDAIAELLGVRRVVITRSDPSPDVTRDLQARSAAEVLAQSAREHATIGISWSRTLDLMAHYIGPLPRCEVVQLAGALPVPGAGNSFELLHRIGTLSGGPVWPVWAPLVVDDGATAAGLRRTPEIAAALAKAEVLDVAMVSLAAWTAGSSTVWSRANSEERAEAERQGAVGECSGRIFDRDGNPVSTGLDRRVMAVTLEQLRKAPEVIVLARGAESAAATRAVAKAGVATTLIIDSALAAALLGPSDRVEAT